ncbi:MAG: assimilatory sulfite reductase (NADPH) hemoprotein subunit [Thermoguttaceae bacterium]|jgi:sulfite reductase (NADPH) hemoprotein beta-component
MDAQNLSDAERLKAASRYLRGTITQSLADRLTGAVAEGDAQLLKFHGTYQQDDRDLRNERARQKLEPAYEFMIRVRVPGGIVTPQQWLALDRLARTSGNGTLRLTTRQTFQLHGVLKWRLAETIEAINEAGLTTIAACGDVNRNVMCNPNPCQSELHGEVHQWAMRINEHLLPATTAYREIWLGQPSGGASPEDREPIYGPTYLPRKFKIGLAVPPSNDVDVFAQDIGLVAIEEGGRLAGFNVAVGGGLGMTHGETNTYPMLGQLIGWCAAEQVVDVAREILLVQRDFGDRGNRKHARLKYTIDDRGLDWFKGELQQRLGWQLQDVRPFRFEHRGDRFGWVKGTNGNWHLTLFVPCGRIRDGHDQRWLTGLRSIAEVHDGDFRLTANQNVILGNVSLQNRPRIEELLARYGLGDKQISKLGLNSMSCVAFPTCGLAMAESERYLPQLLARLESLFAEAGLSDAEVVVRMTGCPNGCARPYIAEIALVGKALGKYNLYLGGDFSGARLNRLYRENIDENEILDALRPLIADYTRNRQVDERFGDFVIRAGHVRPVQSGRDFHGR